jgi:hypothetical protein
MVDRKCTMKKVKTNGIGADASSAVPKRCGRCATAIVRNDFCPECTEFFEGLSSRKVVFATVVRRTQKDWSGVSRK